MYWCKIRGRPHGPPEADPCVMVLGARAPINFRKNLLYVCLEELSYILKGPLKHTRFTVLCHLFYIYTLKHQTRKCCVTSFNGLI